MVGRAAMSNPMVFREINEFLEFGGQWKPRPEDKVKCFFEYWELCNKFGVSELNDLRAKAMHFTKGIELTKATRVRLQKAKSAEEIKSELSGLLEKIGK